MNSSKAFPVVSKDASRFLEANEIAISLAAFSASIKAFVIPITAVTAIATPPPNLAMLPPIPCVTSLTIDPIIKLLPTVVPTPCVNV